ncbi:uncharacterized protein LOC117174970 [Belonocnema kinseyi]|uniref:uncharacterized protein LOC117174970 n=1 Tax=Belonocnema kinseyi TaxID=2817044 RepID=UPI00143CCC8A|nr:uncharacterized protein LOC117174970 [Belonocnema kinseyi]
MYKNEMNLAYILFLRPILSDIQRTNKCLESNNTDPTKLFQDLTLLVRSIAAKMVLPTYKIDVLTSQIQNYLDPTTYLGFAVETKLEELSFYMKSFSSCFIQTVATKITRECCDI